MALPVNLTTFHAIKMKFHQTPMIIVTRYRRKCKLIKKKKKVKWCCLFSWQNPNLCNQNQSKGITEIATSGHL